MAPKHCGFYWQAPWGHGQHICTLAVGHEGPHLCYRWHDLDRNRYQCRGTSHHA